ncbi:SDR family NAD(P)-dependent oxidoreductase [Bradyrhizobium sp. Pha-3]|uniref:SDR family NAD(P)-dependent oxidoreductase n=1 Tax=Bradyrhizobium sp. Pha-3 TaxID=208375 RepID=UPI0035D4D787
MSGLVVITGATGGIGRCVARQLGNQGLVPVVGHRRHKSDEARAIAEACGGLSIAFDMADPSSIDRGIALLAKDGRPVVGAVLAASPPPVVAPFGKISAADHSLFWTANVVGPQYLLAGLVRQFFRPRKAGSVAAVLTGAIRVPEAASALPKVMSSMGAYSISKFGLLGVMAQLSSEFPWLRVSSVMPGFTETDMLKVFDERFLDQLRLQGAFAKPEDVAVEIVDRLALSAIK